VKTALLDVNVLIALAWPAHEHHNVAHRWLGERGEAHWATTPLTQLGFARIVSNPSFSSDALEPADALALLDDNLASPRHQFWPDTMQVPSAMNMLQARLEGHRQLTDAYLLVLAGRKNGVFATFDRGVRAVASAAFESALEIIPTR
jgi:toxin-antitoxin system PIN domain toxin